MAHKSNSAVAAILAAANGILASVTINDDLVKALLKQQDWIGLTGLELRQAIHNNASLCMYMAEKSDKHDAHALAKLVNRVDSSFRLKGLVGWIQMFSPIRFDGDGKIGVLKEGDKGYTPWKTQDAFNTPFWTIKELDEKVPTELSVEAFRAMISKFRNQIIEANDKGEVVSKAGKVTKTIKGDRAVLLDLVDRTYAISPRPQSVVQAPAEQPTMHSASAAMQPIQAAVG